MPEAAYLNSVRDALRADGIFHLSAVGPELRDEVLEGIGAVIHRADVAVDLESRSLVMSDEAIELHTDHHRADVIVWHCVEQTDEGGESTLVDAEPAYLRLTPEQQRVLQTIELAEHRIFADDRGTYPLVHLKQGRPRFYYSPWLLDEPAFVAERDAVRAFQAALARRPRHSLKLRPGDLLGIDNGRILHGRSAIGGSRQRLLRRYWVHADWLHADPSSS